MDHAWGDASYLIVLILLAIALMNAYLNGKFAWIVVEYEENLHFKNNWYQRSAQNTIAIAMSIELIIILKSMTILWL